ncbi:MAG TPA: lysophospholipid acyltransferase family protein [Candidatus Binatia bacterium]|nr:lysophospholipid acyltransferase family protein [Candidatus Binatia bacterium]
MPVAPTPPRKRSLWKRFRRATRGPRNAVLAQGIFLMGRAVGMLPVPTGLALGRALGRGAHTLLGTPRELALKHVGEALPELNPTARAQLVRATFEHAGQSFTELGLWRKLAHDPAYVRIDGLDVLEEALAEGRGTFAVTGHVGNWELLAATIAARGYPVSVVARRVNDERFNDLITRFRGDKGMNILLRDAPDFMAQVRAALRAGHIVAILMDQDSRGAGVFVPFFGRLAHTPPGAAVLALRTHAPVVSVFIQRRPEGGHVVTFERVSVEGAGRGQILELTARFTAAIEAAIRKSPSEWVWWHERWRRQPDDGG